MMKLWPALLFLFSALSFAQTETAPTSAYDCTLVQLEEVDPSTLTKEEQIALLEKSLYDSVDNYATCIDKVQTQVAESTGAGTGSESFEGGEEQDGPSNSNSTSENQSDADSVVQSQQNTASGAEDQLIAPKDNDSIVCGILWQEISAEKDQAAKQKLIEQYNSYNCGK